MGFDGSSIEWEPTRQKGIFLSWLLRGAESDDVVVLIRMEPGADYPAHRHRGEEVVLVLQGGYRDGQGEYREGQKVVNPAGSVHHPVALEGPEDCILLAVARQGVEVLSANDEPHH